jgi:hypothetical protein
LILYARLQDSNGQTRMVLKNTQQEPESLQYINMNGLLLRTRSDITLELGMIVPKHFVEHVQHRRVLSAVLAKINVIVNLSL